MLDFDACSAIIFAGIISTRTSRRMMYLK